MTRLGVQGPDPRPLDLAALKDVLNALGARGEVDPRGGPPSKVVMHLAHGLVRAAEQHAIVAEMAAREASAGVEEIGRATGATSTPGRPARAVFLPCPW